MQKNWNRSSWNLYFLSKLVKELIEHFSEVN